MSNPDQIPFRRWTLARGSLIGSMVAIAVVVVIGVLEELGVGIADPSPMAGELPQQIIDVAVGHEERYLRYGRWEDLSLAAAFAGLLLAIPFVKGTQRSRHLLVAGAAVAIVGEVIRLSQLVGIELARWTLENDLAADFTAANTYRFGVNATATYVWTAGLFLAAIGVLIVARDARDLRWRILSALLAISLATNGIAGLSADQPWPDIAGYVLATVALAWIVTAMGRLEDPHPRSQREPGLETAPL